MNLMKIPLFCIFYMTCLQLSASHLLGGYISYRWVGVNQYDITVNLLTDQRSGVPGGQDGILDLGDGFLVSDFNTTTEEISEDISLVSFSVLYTFGSLSSYEISYMEPNYNNGINNMEGSGGTPFFITALIVNDIALGTNKSPVLRFFGAQEGLTGTAQRISSAAFDEDGDSLSYELIIPRQARELQIPGYFHLNDSTLYTDYSTGNQANNGPPPYSISPVTGEILWDAPGFLGQYAIAYKIIQWRKFGETWRNMGENEVILMNNISDERADVSITAPASQCYDDAPSIQGQFDVEGFTGGNQTLQVFSDLGGILVNGRSISAGEVLTFKGNIPPALEVTVPSSAEPRDLKLYRVIAALENGPRTVTATWAFSVGCDSLPGNVGPPPIPREETCDAFIIYPNPSRGQTVELCLPNNTDRPRHIRIIDSAGKVMFERDVTVSTSLLELDTRFYPSGLYFLQVNRSTWKFAVQR